MSFSRVFSILPSVWDRIKPKEQAPVSVAKPQVNIPTPIIQHCIVEDWKKAKPPK